MHELICIGGGDYMPPHGMPICCNHIKGSLINGACYVLCLVNKAGIMCQMINLVLQTLSFKDVCAYILNINSLHVKKHKQIIEA